MERKTIYRVVVSSTYMELADHRRAIREAMPAQRMLPLAMEDDAALPDRDLIDASLAKVEEADGYVGLISYRYGQRPVCQARNPDRLSLTELEFRRALTRDIPICMFIMHPEHPIPSGEVGKETGAKQKFKAFVELAKKDRIYAEFKSIEDLRTKGVQSLVRLREVLDEHSAPAELEPQNKDPREPRERTEAAGRPAGRFSNIPINVPLHFLGRDEELKAIDAALKGGRVAALHGLRGAGKSTLAAAYAERHKAEYCATWWIRAASPDTMRADLVALGVRLGWVAADEKEEPALAAVRERLRHEGEGLLLVYDNAIDAASVRPFLPAGGAARALVTSNSPAWRGLAAPVEIPLWSKEVGADYLIARTGSEEGRAEAEALSEALGGLTLAHEQAAAYCERLGLPLAEYRKRFAAAPEPLLDTAKDVSPEYHGGLTVAKAFGLAIDEAAKLHPAAEPLISYAALLAPEPIPLFLFSEARETFGEPFASGIAGDGLDEAVAALRAFALVDRETIPDERDPSIATDTIRLHRLVRIAGAARRQGDALEASRRALILAMAAVYPRDVLNDPATWPRARRLDVLVLGLVGHDAPLPGAETSASYLLDRLASYRYAVLAAYSEARPLLERALAIVERAYGLEHPETATSLNNLAAVFRDLGDLAAARPLHERALAIREKARGSDHPDVAQSLNNLAALLNDQDDLAGARPLLERALAIQEKALGSEHPLTAASLGNLGYLLRRQGDLPGARMRLEQALTIQRKVLDEENPVTNLTRANLAGVRLAEGAPSEALAMAETALAAHDKLLGPNHLWTKWSAGVVAYALEALGRADDAAVVRAKYGI
ncbi:MAG TPA: tetratricopeptide repeat protein [Roseiarcus sp.]|nr:tetratricopeptide repeat protein [Roseiarcus sp.]